MRPHLLSVTAFGAFGATVGVSFDDLAAAGLFLLHGETGAGKTTLLDAIGFALYGRVPGERGKARRLRSDHAAPGTPTEVRLEATVGGRRLRVTRRPEQDRPKLRGNGVTTEPAKVLLEESLAGAWHTVSTRAGEADQEIADLMGMSADQFFQVVLLPQGQFAQFLHADAADRARLLQRLFGTDRFRAVEDWLAQRRRTTAHEVAQAETEITKVAARVAQVAGLTAADDGADVMLPSPEWAVLLADAAGNEAASAAGRVARGRADLDAALAAQRAADQLAERQRRRADAIARRTDLAAAEAGIETLRRELAAAARAAEVAPALAEVERTVASCAQACLREEAARGAADEEGEPADASAAGLRAAASQRLEQLGQLETLRSLADQAAAEDLAGAQARQRAASLDGQITRCEAGIAADRERRPALAGQRDTAREAAERLPDATADAHRYRRGADDAQALLAAQGERDRHAAAHLTAREQAVGLREQAARLREARIDGMRAELAASLVDDTPCPVCGALDHPEPCELRGEPVTRAQEEEATARAEAASAQVQAVGELLAAARGRAADLADRLAGAGFLADPAGTAARPEISALPDIGTSAVRELTGQAQAREAEAGGLGDTAGRLTELQGALDALDTAIADADKHLAELIQQREAALAEADQATRRAAGHRDSLRGRLGGAPDLDSALASTRAAAQALTAAADAADAAARARADAERALGAAVQACADAGFDDLDTARASLRDSSWRALTDTKTRNHETSARAVVELLANPELDVPLDPPGRQAAQAAVAVASEALEQAVAHHASARSQADQLADLAPELAKRLAEMSPLIARADETRQIADLAAGLGANTRKMTLSAFVLAARLEEVAAAASQRLLTMTAGRYSLAHTDARRGAGKSGLGLLACDTWTGVDRDTSTLSGGETFLASLALALGLADVVTAEAGGTRIEALFVDEGFGTLDEETLEEVMNVLDSLREGGRIVGIVSHVAELRQRIPAQIRVHRGKTGSSLSSTGAT